MASYWRGGVDRGTDVDDFEEFDPTPYGGGYDLHMTYGRPLPPSEEICYPISSSDTTIDYDRPSYSSGSNPSAYDPGNRYDDSENRYGGRPKPQPAYGFHPQAEEQTPEYGYGGSQENEYGRHPQPRPEYGYGGGEYGGRQENEYGGSGFGGGRQEGEYGGGEYGYGGRPKRDEEENPSYGYGGGRQEGEYGGFGYGGRPERFGEEEKPTYGYGQERVKRYGEEGGEYGGGEYGYEKPSRYGRDEDTGTGYGERRNSSGNDSDDNEERKHHHHGHRHRRSYDDE